VMSPTQSLLIILLALLVIMILNLKKQN